MGRKKRQEGMSSNNVPILPTPPKPVLETRILPWQPGMPKVSKIIKHKVADEYRKIHLVCHQTMSEMRVAIVFALVEKPLTTNQLAATVSNSRTGTVSSQVISQHLLILKLNKIVAYDQEGVLHFYFLTPLGEDLARLFVSFKAVADAKEQEIEDMMKKQNEMMLEQARAMGRLEEAQEMIEELEEE